MMLINGVHYHVETHGAGDPLVLLHGFSGSGANWASTVEALAPHYRVVTVDLLGHGQTESPADAERYRIERGAADLIAIFDALRLDAVDLLGYSMGGRLALYLAVTYPARVRRLILESASPGLRTEAERAARIEQDEALARRIERDGIAAFAAYWTNLPLFASQSLNLRERLYMQRLHNDPTGLASSLRGMGTGAQSSLWEHLPALDLPVLLLCGALDEKFLAINREMQALLPRASLAVVPDAGHTVHAEQPEHFRSQIERFLRVLP